MSSSSTVLSTPRATPTLLPPSHPLDSQYDHRSALEVVGWCMAIMASLVVLARMGTKWSMSSRLGMDDVLITISLLLAFGQTASLSTAVANGLGLTPQTPAEEAMVNMEGQQKSMYAFNILFVVSQCFAKISIAVFTGRITPVMLHRQTCRILVITITTWAVTATVALLFQCQASRPWQTIGDDVKCINRVSLYTYVEVANAILDVVLIAIPVTIVWSVQQRRARKVAIIGTFLTRSTVIAVIIVQLAVLHHNSNASDASTADPFLRWNFAICTQFIEYLSIVSACALYLRPFVRGAASGMLGHTTSENPKNLQYYQLRYQLDGRRFGRTRTRTAVVISGRDPRSLSPIRVEAQGKDLTMNITVKKDFEMYESIVKHDSAGSRQSDHEITEPAAGF